MDSADADATENYYTQWLVCYRFRATGECSLACVESGGGAFIQRAYRRVPRQWRHDPRSNAIHHPFAPRFGRHKQGIEIYVTYQHRVSWFGRTWLIDELDVEAGDEWPMSCG